MIILMSWGQQYLVYRVNEKEPKLQLWQMGVQIQVVFNRTSLKKVLNMTHSSIDIGPLTHWGRVTHKYVGKLTTIGSDNDLSPGRRQDIIWTIAGILLIGPLGTNFSEILIRIQTFSFKKMHLKMSSAKWRPSCLGLNVLKQFRLYTNLSGWIKLYVVEILD